MKLFTIIIPVFNKNQYLKTLLHSIVEFTEYEIDFEVLFVDDASTDNSVEIINEYAFEYSFIKLIELKENSGSPAKPRNIGIEEANGKYIFFLDADDWISSKGLSHLLRYVEENNSDIGFGQSYRHTNNKVQKIARFSSYAEIPNINPNKIERVYRALGPPGKIIKKSIIEENGIRFKDLKYGEDKLFFIEVISNCTKASMLPMPVYHVNRYSENTSLIKETSVLEKAEFNLLVLKEVLQLDLTDPIKNMIISRIIEVDFIRRMLYKKTFLRSSKKKEYYNIFEKLEVLLQRYEISIKNYIFSNDYKNIYHLYKFDKNKLILYIEYSLLHRETSKYVQNNLVYYKFPESLTKALLNQVAYNLYAVSLGTHHVNGYFFDIIQLYKEDDLEINSISLTEVSNELNEFYIPFELKNDKLYIDIREYTVDYDFNIRITYENYKSTLVYQSFPNAPNYYVMKKQNQKIEYNNNIKKEKNRIDESKYIKIAPKYIVNLKNIYLYNDVNFKEKMSEKVSPGKLFSISGIEHSKDHTPRLKLTKNNLYISANLSYVKPIDVDKISDYI